MSNDQAPPGPMEIMTEGWAGIEARQPTQEEIAEQAAEQEQLVLERRREDQLFHKVFTKGNGAEVLQVLRAMTIEQPCFNPEAGENAAYMGFTREGQNSVIREIETRIARAEENPGGKSKRKTGQKTI